MNESPAFIVPEFQVLGEPTSLVEVWVPERFFHFTVSPGLTCVLSGEKAKPAMLTV
jgi:hypothetical protein